MSGRMMRGVFLALLALVLTACSPPEIPGQNNQRLSPVSQMVDIDTTGYQRAIEPREFVFPRDHERHPGFKLEWWYLVGNLSDDDGRRFGFQLTFFRNALTPEEPQRSSRWATNALYLAHFALTDVEGEQFFSFERTSRETPGVAGVETEPFQVAVDDWRLTSQSETFLPLEVYAQGDRQTPEKAVALELLITDTKPIVLHGENGLSRKGPEEGNASYYYSMTRLQTHGKVRLGERQWNVSGTAWLDREWSTGVLNKDQIGWDWFALQLDDGRELMLYQVRAREGEPSLRGTLVATDSSTQDLKAEDFVLEVTEKWTSPEGVTYPGGWRIQVPLADLELRVKPFIADQELDVTFSYWEGAVGVSLENGQENAGPLVGRGYVELVGYGDG